MNNNKNISTAKKRALAAALGLLTFTMAACSSDRSWPAFEACARAHIYSDEAWQIAAIKEGIKEWRANGLRSGERHRAGVVECENVMPR